MQRSGCGRWRWAGGWCPGTGRCGLEANGPRWLCPHSRGGHSYAFNSSQNGQPSLGRGEGVGGAGEDMRGSDSQDGPPSFRVRQTLPTTAPSWALCTSISFHSGLMWGLNVLT